MRHRDAREEIIRVARAAEARGLNHGTAGNVSARVPEGLLITPSAVSCDDLEPDGLALLTLEGEALDDDDGVGDGAAPDRAAADLAAADLVPGPRPSTEWRLHARVLRERPEVGAVLHAHAPFCTALACVRRDIPAFHYMVAVAGGDSIRCAGYATFGTPELAGLAVAALEGRTACLLANHGMLALGESPGAALALATEVEALAAAYWRALQVGEPVILSRAEMAAVAERFRDYRS